MAYGTINAEQLTTQSGFTLGAGNASSFKNRILNGNMVIDQRNAGASVSFAAGNFPVDRMRLSTNGGTATATVQQNLNSLTPPTGFTNYIGVTVTSGVAATGSESYRITQRIEGFNVADLGWGAAGAQAVTLSFWVRASITGTYGGSLQNSAENRSYVFSYTINTANTWEYKTATITGDTTGTWLTNNGIGILLLFSVGTGASLQTAAGSWGSSGNTVTGQTNLIGTTGATFYITGVQLEVGTVATSFDFRDYGRELIMCQRYFEKSYSTDVALGTNTLVGVSASVAGSSGTNLYGGSSIVFKVTKRVNPTMAGWTYTGVAGSWHYGVFGVSEGIAAISFSPIGASQVTPFMSSAATSQNALYGQWTASSEL